MSDLYLCCKKLQPSLTYGRGQYNSGDNEMKQKACQIFKMINADEDSGSRIELYDLMSRKHGIIIVFSLRYEVY